MLTRIRRSLARWQRINADLAEHAESRIPNITRDLGVHAPQEKS